MAEAVTVTQECMICLLIQKKELLDLGGVVRGRSLQLRVKENTRAFNQHLGGAMEIKHGSFH